MKIKLLALFFGLFATTACWSQPAEFTVHHAPGGPSDIVTRHLNQAMNNEFVVVNRPGAQGRLATKHLLEAKTIMVATMGQIYVNNVLMFGKDLEYNPDQDLELIGVVGSMPSVLVCNKKKNIRSIADIAPNMRLNFGVAGYGSSEHLATEALVKRLGLQNHVIVPYSRGGATAVNDMLGGSLDCMFANYPTVRGFVDHPELVFVMSSHANLDGIRLPTWLQVFKEKFPFDSYLGVVIAKSTELSARNKYTQLLSVAFENPELREKLKKAGLFVVASVGRLDIQAALENNSRIRTFVVNNNIKLLN
jgi:tripartite-type tricarboxylate transporter receptor subunit TctC